MRLEARESSGNRKRSRIRFKAGVAVSAVVTLPSGQRRSDRRLTMRESAMFHDIMAITLRPINRQSSGWLRGYHEEGGHERS